MAGDQVAGVLGTGGTIAGAGSNATGAAYRPGGLSLDVLVGHLAAWNYFMSLKNPQNDAFIKMYKAWAIKQNPKCDRLIVALNSDASVRGRVVLSADAQDAFIDLENTRGSLFYGVVDADLAPGDAEGQHRQGELQRSLETVEGEIQMSRRYYNGAARDLNVKVESFPNNLVAGQFGFSKKPYFEIANEADRAVPTVKF